MRHDLVHGGSLDKMRAAFPNASGPWIDLSTGINPWPYPVPDVSPDTLNALPTRDAYQQCRAAMASVIGVPADTLALAPGSELLIRMLPQIISPKRVAVLTPTYGDHAQVWRTAGCDVLETTSPLSLSSDVDAVAICNPNNPDGRLFQPDELEAARAKLAERGGWLIVDEAYTDLAPELSLARHAGAPGLIVLRSFGKFYGLAGLRLGAIIASEDILRPISNLLGVWPVSGLALDIGKRAYQDTSWQVSTRARLDDARRRLDEILVGTGIKEVHGTNLFRFVECEDAHLIWRRLAERGIYVRRFSWSNQHLRFGLIANEAAETRLLEALSLSV